MFHFIDLPYFVTHSWVDGSIHKLVDIKVVSSFCLFENAAMNMYVQVFGQMHVFKSLGISLHSPRIYLVVELLGHQANLRLFKETMDLRYHLFYTLTFTRQH